MRTTKAMLIYAFNRAANAKGWDTATKRWDNGKARIGSVSLEHNSVYGWNINQIVNEAGGERRLRESCSASQMLAWLEGIAS